MNSNDILSSVRYPDLSTGTASAGQQVSYLVDALGEQVQMTDRNGTLHQYTRDSFGRVTKDSATVASGNPHNVDTTVKEHDFSFDTAGNATGFATKDASGNVLTNVSRTFNGFHQVISESQTHGTNTAQVVGYDYDSAHASRLTKMTYPDGRAINYLYNTGVDSDISRLSSITSTPSGGTASSTVESYGYLGPYTVLTVTRGNGIVGNTTLDSFGRTGSLVWSSGTNVVDGFNYGYDFNSNVTSKENIASPSNSETYGYDNLDRLTDFKRGTLSGSTITTATANESWTLDGLGNWSSHPQRAGVTRPPQHHVFPQNARDRAWFAKRGIDVDKFTVTLDQGTHQALHYGGGPGKGGGLWNETIMSELKRTEADLGRKLKPEEIIQIGKDMMNRAKLGDLPFEEYGKPQ